MRAALKAVERAGRGALLRATAWVARWLGGGPRALALPQHRPPRFLVVRLDQRLGNLLLTTPLLLTLARRYPGCAIDVVVHAPNVPMLAGLPFVRRVYPFAKWSLFGRRGAARLVHLLRRNRYDVCLDATNPSGPSTTQALLVRASGAGFRIGYGQKHLAGLYDGPVALSEGALGQAHEIDLRLALLEPLGPGPCVRTMAVAPPWPPPSPAVADWLEGLGTTPYVAINLGARLATKRLHPADYAVVANACTATGLRPVLVWGPGERHLLAPVLRLAADALAAPPTQLQDLACVLRGADAVVSADTGPMHLAVALGRPTLGLFLATPRHRYGHTHGPHRAIDARALGQEELLAAVRAFLAERRGTAEHDVSVGGRPLGMAHLAQGWGTRPAGEGRHGLH